jgi:hypothetical protein
MFLTICGYNSQLVTGGVVPPVVPPCAKNVEEMMEKLVEIVNASIDAFYIFLLLDKCFEMFYINSINYHSKNEAPLYKVLIIPIPFTWRSDRRPCRRNETVEFGRQQSLKLPCLLVEPPLVVA